MKKVLFFLLLLLILPTVITAQQTSEGEGEEMSFSIISKVQSYIDEADGWSLQDNGKWASAKNRIPYSDYRTNKNPSPNHKLGVENFNVLELKKVMINDIQYNVLLIKYNDGEFEFPILKEGWKPFESLEFFVFDALSLSKILPFQPTFNKAYAVNMNVLCAGRIKNYDPKIIDDKIVARIQSALNKTKINASNLVFAVMPIKKGDVESIKFKLIRSFSKRSLISWYLDPRNTDKLFDVSYYETKFFNFKNFIRNSEVYNIPTSGKPEDTQSYLKWGILKYHTGNYDEAIEDFNSALNYDSDTMTSLIYSYRGIARTKIGNYSAAIEDFDKAIDFQPNDLRGYSNWIKNYHNRGVSRFYTNDIEGACDDWKKAFDLGFGRALEYIERFCK